MANRNALLELLIQIFGRENVVREWDVAKKSQDDFTRSLYCPRMDFAVDPFNTDRSVDYNNSLIDATFDKYAHLIDRINSISHKKNELKANPNPRCFLAIELEKTGSRKHRIGSIINASGMGKFGILVAEDNDNYKLLVKVVEYLKFLKAVDKVPSMPENLMIVKFRPLIKVLQDE